MTFLSILANDAIALPLSSSFPVGELRYIVENSEALILLSTEKFKDKAEEVLRDGLNSQPILGFTEKIEAGAGASQDITLDGTTEGKGGLMLYTSGTTSRPVRKPYSNSLNVQTNVKHV